METLEVEPGKAKAHGGNFSNIEVRSPVYAQWAPSVHLDGGKHGTWCFDGTSRLMFFDVMFQLCSVAWRHGGVS